VRVSQTPAPQLPRAVVFDFDLTLADSSTAVVECSNRALAELGFQTAEPQRVRGTIGLTLPQAFRELTGADDPLLAAEFSKRFVAHADGVMVLHTHVYPAVPALLASLRSRGVRLAIVSTKFRYRIEAILSKSGIPGAVDVIVGGEDVKQHKPHAEGLLCALERLEVPASLAVYVGDHPLDAETAARAGTAFVAVRTGVSTTQTWSSWQPLDVIDDLGGLLDVLARERDCSTLENI
jgi:phosphoglycolate phosphatase